LRGNSFSEVPEGLAPQGPRSSVFARLASGAFYETFAVPTIAEFAELWSIESVLFQLPYMLQNNIEDITPTLTLPSEGEG
jgi:hypothetical protein